MDESNETVLSGRELVGKGRMILLALGANLPSAKGTPKETLRAALASLGARGITVERQSGFYASEAWPNPSDPPFVNATIGFDPFNANPIGRLLTVGVSKKW